MVDAPDLGDRVDVDGVEAPRILTMPGNGMAYDMGSYPKLSTALPTFCDGAEHVTDESSKDYGKPIIESRRQEDRLCAMHGYTRDYDARDLE